MARFANAMRKDGEVLDAGRKHQVIEDCLNPPYTNHAQLVEVISAVPPEEFEPLDLWLDDQPREGCGKQWQTAQWEFLSAPRLDVAGKRSEIIDRYKVMQKEIRTESFPLNYEITQAIVSLTKAS